MAKQYMVETAEKTTRGMGTHDTASLMAAYPASPIHSGDINDQSVKELAQQLLMDGIVNDGGHTFGEFNRDYVDAPVMADVDVAGKNLASPYVPNPSSPGPGSMNASDIGDAPEGFGQEPTDQFGSGVGSQLSPDQSSTSQSTGEINDYQFGKAPGSI
tara:strand:+ start:18476 stop:18949 length:474 start_codon:yes stop_codon:yes gene_type:complete